MWKSVVLALLVAALAAAPARATENPSSASGWAETEHGAVRLIAAVEAVGEGATVPIALQFRMNPGWHLLAIARRCRVSAAGELVGIEESTSARSAGPFRVDSRARHGDDRIRGRRLAGRGTAAAAERTVGPARHRGLPDLRRYLRPLHRRARPRSAGGRGAAFDIRPISPARALSSGPRFGAWIGHRAGAAGRRPVRGGNGDRPPLGRAAGRSRHLRRGSAPLAFSAPQISLSADGRAARLALAVFNGDGLGRTFDGLPITLTVIDGERTLEHATRIRAAPDGQAVTPGAIVPNAAAPFLAMLGAALLGGLILNLMPCVLPVLSMKLLAVVGHGGGPRRAVRAGFSPLPPASCSRSCAGWRTRLSEGDGSSDRLGPAFQQPWFLTAMILILTLFACNLWGFFECRCRAFGFADERAGRVRGLAGHFLTGALATLLATPCSAPFLGTAIGFALSRGAAEIFTVFTAVAGGLALPYLIVAAFPAMASRLPKPGPWMSVLRRALGLALAGTAAWLVWVLAGGIGEAGASVVGGIAAAGPFCSLSADGLPGASAPSARPVWRRSPWPLSWSLPIRQRTTGKLTEARGGRSARAYPGVVADGRTVFVNVTADWCLTCKVNERLVLSRDPVRRRLAEDAVVAMQGDWTAPDDRIARYLAGFGRYGIPFDAVYGPALPQGEALPELLSAEVVEAALARASGEPGGR